MFTTQFKVLVGFTILLVIMAGILSWQVRLQRDILATQTAVSKLDQSLTVTPSIILTATPSATIAPVRSQFVPSYRKISPAVSATVSPVKQFSK